MEALEKFVAANESWIGFAAIALIAIGGTTALMIVSLDPTSGVRRRLARYEASLDKEIEFLLYRTTGQKIARIQIGIIAAILVGSFLLDDVFFLALVPFVAVIPIAVLQRRRDKRIAAIELQLDGWLMVLSNALKAAPSLGEALATSQSLSRPPMSEEVDLVLKEIRLGNPTDQALLHMAARCNSRTLWGAVATLLVSRQTGGDVSRILEDSADTLREMARLEGVVKTKTADGRAQAYVLGVLPVFLLAAIHFVDPNWLSALGSNALGYLITIAAATLWILGFLSARRILAVDI
ncbi:MAG TPA: type II secretion system F family protein [Kofleriaceae bacterium]|nr:type II secretion system F family protein [Kofleriaceae bacterium]